MNSSRIKENQKAIYQFQYVDLDLKKLTVTNTFLQLKKCKYGVDPITFYIMKKIVKII